jgi:hypothetical protein
MPSNKRASNSTTRRRPMHRCPKSMPHEFMPAPLHRQPLTPPQRRRRWRKAQQHPKTQINGHRHIPVAGLVATLLCGAAAPKLGVPTQTEWTHTKQRKQTNHTKDRGDRRTQSDPPHHTRCPAPSAQDTKKQCTQKNQEPTPNLKAIDRDLKSRWWAHEIKCA